jgi:hypothetical protein
LSKPPKGRYITKQGVVYAASSTIAKEKIGADFLLNGGWNLSEAFHLACISHQTRLRNSLRTPEIDMIEKALLKQRIVNMKVAQAGYLAKQKKALS